MTVPVRLEHCAKSFGAGQVLTPIDLDIPAGQTLVLLGPSGCGKTTTLRIIAGLERPDAGGRVLFGSQDVTALPIERRRVGMVFQSYALFPNMTVAQNVAYGLKVRGVAGPARRGRVARMLEMMRISELADRPIARLSGGQKQRVALARAIVVEPDVLLLDEPLAALDAKLRELLRVEIDALLRELGITAVYVTHDQGEAMALADRIAVMERGRIAQIGTPRDIWFSPTDPFVAEFIGISTRAEGHVAHGMLHLLGAAVPWPGPDGPAVVTLRPDAGRLVDGPGAGVLTGTVHAAQFLGDCTRLAVIVTPAIPPDIAPGTATGMPGSMLLLDSAARTAPRVGDRVHVALDPADLIVLPAPR